MHGAVGFEDRRCGLVLCAQAVGCCGKHGRLPRYRGQWMVHHFTCYSVMPHAE